VSQFTPEGALRPDFALNGLLYDQLSYRLPSGASTYDVLALLPLRDGRAVVSGSYSTGSGAAAVVAGSWLLMLTADGHVDQQYGKGRGFASYSKGFYLPVAQVADGTVWGVRFKEGFDYTTKLGIARFGKSSKTPPSKEDLNALPFLSILPFALPRSFLPGGKLIAITERYSGGTQTIGLVRFSPKAAAGNLDPQFGAAAQDPGRLIRVGPDPNLDVFGASSRGSNFRATGAFGPGGRSLGGPRGTGNWADVVSLPDGSFLVLMSVVWSETPIGPLNARSQDIAGLLLLAFEPDGTPKPMAGWNGRPARIYSRYAGFGHPLGWQPHSAYLQPDGSLMVGLAGNDPAVPGDDRLPTWFGKQLAYFCRLISPNYDIDPGFDGDGSACRRIVRDHARFEDQWPVSLASTTGTSVAAAIAIGTLLRDDYPLGSGVVDLPPRAPIRSPDLPFDGSVGLARLA
jgi:hypothetical protein